MLWLEFWVTNEERVCCPEPSADLDSRGENDRDDLELALPVRVLKIVEDGVALPVVPTVPVPSG